MPSNFASLMKNRSKNKAKLAEELDKMQGKGKREIDERFWKLEVDKAGNGFAIIRFLPAPPGEGETAPFIRYWNYGFKGPKGWYIEKSPKSIGLEDPVFDFNGKLYDAGDEQSKKQANNQKRSLNFIFNILVIKDPANPENEGKVFLYRCGPTIFDMIKDFMEPNEELGEEPEDVTDFIEGRNFRLKAYNGPGDFRKYDKSSFDAPSQLADTEEEMEAIWNKEYPLQPFLDPKEFKSYEELQKRLYTVLGLSAAGASASQTRTQSRDTGEDDEDDLGGDGIPNFGKEEPAPSAGQEASPSELPSSNSEEEDDDDDIDFFKGLADD